MTEDESGFRVEMKEGNSENWKKLYNQRIKTGHSLPFQSGRGKVGLPRRRTLW